MRELIPDDYSGSIMNIHLPITLLALAIAVFIAAQIASVDRGEKTMRWQLANYDKQKENLQNAQNKLTDLIKKREELVKQSTQVQQQYTALLNDVLELAKDDADAKSIVQKWGIQRNANAAAAGASGSTTGTAASDEKPAATAPVSK